jgi:hypothetical protein
MHYKGTMLYGKQAPELKVANIKRHGKSHLSEKISSDVEMEKDLSLRDFIRSKDFMEGSGDHMGSTSLCSNHGALSS